MMRAFIKSIVISLPAALLFIACGTAQAVGQSEQKNNEPTTQETTHQHGSEDGQDSAMDTQLVNPPNPGNCSKYGPDSNKTLDIAFLWADYYKKKEYAQSLKFWRHMFNKAPGYQESVHITGIKMYQDLIERMHHNIEYEVTSDKAGFSVTYTNEGQHLEQTDHKGSTWKKSIKIDSGTSISLSAQSDNEEAKITVKILQNGQVIEEANSQGDFIVASASGTVTKSKENLSAKDSITRDRLIDTLLMIYDKRIECFGNEGYLLGRKGYELMKYRGKNYDQIRALFTRSIELQEDKTEYFLLYPYAKLMAYEYRKDNMTLEEILEVYFTVADIVDKNKGGEYEENYTKAMESIVDYYKQINVLNCETMRKYYADMYRNSPDDPEVWKKAKIGLEGCSTCDETFQEMNKKLLEVEPSSELAARIADCEIKIGKTSEALKYYDKALELAETKERKATLSYAVAVLFYNEQGNYPKARQYAQKALEYRPNWGDPYILIGKMYASSGAECKKESDINGYAVSWVAVDKFMKAKSVDPSVTEEANRLIATYQSYFPPTMEPLWNTNYNKEGVEYKIGCWINETTTVRLKPN